MSDKTSSVLEEKDRFLTFNVGNECFSVPLLTVKEVIAVPETTPIPYAPKHFEGMMNLRGQIISVIDLRKKMKISPLENQEENAVIIMDIEPLTIGVVVDSVNNVLQLESGDIAPPPQVQGSVPTEFLQGVVRRDDRLVVLLDISKLLDVADLKAMNSEAA